MADRTLTINHADGDSETYTIKRDKFAGVREMSVDGSTVTVDRTAVPKEQSKETTFGGSQSITIKRDIDPLLSKVVGGAPAAYSLRDLNDKAGNNKVVRVRRSSDNNEKDFTAKEVSNGTLTAWVGADVNLYTSDFSVDADGLTTSNGTLEGNIDGIDGVDDTLRLTISGGDTSHTVNVLGAGSGLSYTFSFDYYIPSANTSLDGIDVQVPSSSYTSAVLNVTDTWTTVNLSITPDATGTLRFRTYDGVSRTPDGDGDVVYIKNIVFTQTTADGFVETWYDQSGNDNDAVQLTASNQPKIVDAGVLTPKALTYDGTNDLIEADASLGYIGDMTKTYLVVFNSNALSDDRNIVSSWGAGSNALGWFLRLKLDGSILFSGRQVGGVGGIGNEVSVATGLDDGQDHLLYFQISISTTTGLATILCSIDGTVDAFDQGSGITGPTYADVTTTKLVIGARSTSASNASTDDHFDGGIKEFTVYPSDQSANRAAIEANINNQYDIY